MSKGKANPRRQNGSARTKIRQALKATGGPCDLCGQPIDYSLPHFHPDAFEVDEKVPVSLGGNPLDMDNVQRAHRKCNLERGNMTMQQWWRYVELKAQGMDKAEARKRACSRSRKPAERRATVADPYPTSRDW